MHLLELTLPTPAENLSLDEALLETAEAGRVGDNSGEVLRLWEPTEPFVVLGRSSRVAEEVDQAECERRRIPILRRSSGGAAIVAGPGCLMYAVVLSIERNPHLQAIDQAHRHVLETLAAALRPLVGDVAWRGTSDLACGDRSEIKFSGNSLRWKQSHLLYHGTILYDFPLATIAACLKSPPRQPEYRRGRSHAAFVGNFPASRAAIRTAIVGGFNATTPAPAWPAELTRRLVAEKYATPAWNFRL